MSQLAGGRPVGYIQSVIENLISGRLRTNPASGRVEGLNLVPPDYNTSALNHCLLVFLAKEALLFEMWVVNSKFSLFSVINQTVL